MEIDDGKHATLEDVDLLIDTMCRAAETDALYQVRLAGGHTGGSPWVVGRLRYRLGEVLCAWSAGDQARMERVFPALLNSVRLTCAHTASTDLYHVFRWLWPDRRTTTLQIAHGRIDYDRPPPITPRGLTSLARRVIQACCDNPSIWEPPVGNTGLAFSDVGLPETRAGLRDLLDRAA